jgi:hypothetical protein
LAFFLLHRWTPKPAACPVRPQPAPNPALCRACATRCSGPTSCRRWCCAPSQLGVAESSAGALVTGDLDAAPGGDVDDLRRAGRRDGEGSRRPGERERAAGEGGSCRRRARGGAGEDGGGSGSSRSRSPASSLAVARALGHGPAPPAMDAAEGAGEPATPRVLASSAGRRTEARREG